MVCWRFGLLGESNQDQKLNPFKPPPLGMRFDFSGKLLKSIISARADLIERLLKNARA